MQDVKISVLLAIALSLSGSFCLAYNPPAARVPFHFELTPADAIWNQYQEACWFHLGVAYLENDQYLEALNAFSFVVEYNPELPEAYQNMGYASFRLGDFQQAALCLAAVVKLDPQNAHAHHLLGVIFMLYSMYESAVIELEQAVAINPTNALLNFDLGYAQEFNGSFVLAKKAYEKALELNPEFKEAQSRLKEIEDKINNKGGDPLKP